MASLPGVRVNAEQSPVAAACTGGRASGTVYVDAEVEPSLAASPLNPQRLVAAWQQDRASNGGARALVSAVSVDGGQSWVRSLHPMSRCGGAAAGSVGDHERATDPWVDVGPTGIAYLMGLGFSGASLQAGSRNAMLVSRSTDGGHTWAAPVALVVNGEEGFNDKNTLTADPLDAAYVYATWDRLDAAGNGPTLLARSTDAGLTWESARVVYAPSVAGGTSQTIGNRIVVITAGPERGTLVNVFMQIDNAGSVSISTVRAMRSTDRGATWAAPVVVAEQRMVGTLDAASGKRVRDGGIVPAVAAGPDGRLWVAWQDARFVAGQRHDAIAVAMSADGGRTFSAPVAANRDVGVAAFTPTLAVGADGRVALMHYDLRSNTAHAATLLADVWLLHSADGLQWQEQALVRGFDMAQASDAGGLFLGDYHGLVFNGARFTAVAGLSNGSSANRSDVQALVATAPAALRESPQGRSMAAAHRASAQVQPVRDAAALAAARTEALRRGLAQRPGRARP